MITMNNLVVEVDKFIKLSKVSNGTQKRYAMNLNQFIGFLESTTDTNSNEIHLEKIYELVDQTGVTITFLSIDEKLIDRYFFRNIDKGYRWLANNRNTLGSFFKYLIRNYKFTDVIGKTSFNVNHYKPTPKATSILNRHDIIRFLQGLIIHSEYYERDLLLFTLLLSTGCRISELLNIKVKDINFKNDLLKIWMSKVNRERILVLRDGFGELLNIHCNNNKLVENDYLFSSNKGNKLTSSQVRELYHDLLVKAQLPRTRIHDLRHTFATLMYESGSEIIIIQQLLGHKNTDTTQSYVHPNYVRNINIKIKENEEILRSVKKYI